MDKLEIQLKDRPCESRLVIDNPRKLNRDVEVIIDIRNRTIDLSLAGNLPENKVSAQALYSFLKEEWCTDPLWRYNFPMILCPPTQYIFIDDWKLANGALEKISTNAVKLYVKDEYKIDLIDAADNGDKMEIIGVFEGERFELLGFALQWLNYSDLEPDGPMGLGSVDYIKKCDPDFSNPLEDGIGVQRMEAPTREIFDIKNG